MSGAPDLGEPSPFSGSYAAEDVTFLLKRIHLAGTEIAEKERLIQTGQRHYSEMVSHEQPPSDRYMALFRDAFARNRERFARDLAALALALADRPGKEVVIASIARAGTPVGVLLVRLLRRLGRRAAHYSISIIRDRGIDRVALDWMAQRHDPRDIVFVDGWTGKGAITRELSAALDAYAGDRGVRLDSRLAVVADLAGVAGLAASHDDYLIPSSILNAVVSGLVSRTILNADHVGPGDFHACVVYDHLADHDLSRWFVDAIEETAVDLMARGSVAPAAEDAEVKAALSRSAEGFVGDCLERYAIQDRNRIKPGIGEATRALLRRLPDRLMVKESDAVDLAHLVHLAEERGVPLDHRPDLPLPYRAAVIIKTLGEG